MKHCPLAARRSNIAAYFAAVLSGRLSCWRNAMASLLSTSVAGVGTMDFWAFPGRNEIKLPMQPIAYIAQKQPGPLLSFVLDEDTGRARRGDFAYLIAPDGYPTDWGQHLDPAEPPPNRGFPQNGFEDPAGSRRRDNVVADPLDFHLRPGEASIRTAYFETETVHGIPLLIASLGRELPQTVVS